MTRQILAAILCLSLPLPAFAGLAATTPSTTGGRLAYPPGAGDSAAPGATMSVELSPALPAAPDPAAGMAPLLPAISAPAAVLPISAAAQLPAPTLIPAADNPPAAPAPAAGIFAAVSRVPMGISGDPALPEPFGPAQGEENPSVFSRMTAAMERKVPLDRVFDLRAQGPADEGGPVFPSPFYAAPEFGRSRPAKAETPPESPSKPETPGAKSLSRAEFDQALTDLLEHRPLTETAREGLAELVGSARGLRDIEFLEALAYLALHDPRVRTLATQALRTFASDERAVHAVRAEDERVSRMLPFSDSERADFARTLRLRAERYLPSPAPEPGSPLGAIAGLPFLAAAWDSLLSGHWGQAALLGAAFAAGFGLGYLWRLWPRLLPAPIPAPAREAAPASAPNRAGPGSASAAPALRALLEDRLTRHSDRLFKALSALTEEGMALLDSPAADPHRRLEDSARAAHFLGQALERFDARAGTFEQPDPVLRGHLDLLRRRAALETLRAALSETAFWISQGGAQEGSPAALDRAAIEGILARLAQVPARISASGELSLEFPQLEAQQRQWLREYLAELNPDSYDHPGKFDPQLNRHLRPQGPQIADGLRRMKILLSALLES